NCQDSNDGEVDVNEVTKRSHSEIDDTSEIWKSLCGSVPPNMLQSTLENMNASIYQIKGCAMILTAEALELLRSILPIECDIPKVDYTQKKAKFESTKVEDQLLETHEPVTSRHLPVIEAGKNAGLERLVGA
ncbi:hypothetical protein BGZ76_007189, partial [Entomortierella beljakovae]